MSWQERTEALARERERERERESCAGQSKKGAPARLENRRRGVGEQLAVQARGEDRDWESEGSVELLLFLLLLERKNENI